MFLPQIAGAGREFMNEVLNGEINQAATLLLLLAVVKLVMTTISVAAGFVGGTFTPSLFIGLLVGMAYGEVLHGLVGPVVGDPRSYAVAGMAGMMAGVVRAPLTGILLAFEVTNDYRFILPIMLVAVVCVFITERFMKYGVYEFSLVRQGIRLPEGRDVDLMQGITVGEVMFSPAPSIHESASLVELRDTLRAYHRHALCVIDGKGRLTGIVSLSDLQAAYGSGGASPDLTVGDIATRDVVTTRPQEALWTAIRNMGAREVGRLPVVDPTSGELVGIVNRHDIINGYNTVVKRKLHDQQVAEQVRLNTLVGAHVYELAVPGHAPITNKQIKEIPWPPEAVVASIHRKGKMVVPHGKTTIWPGDVLMVVADPHSEIALMELFGHKNPLA
jgi:CIC family chloride channel protein